MKESTAFNKMPAFPVGADLSCPPPIDRPSLGNRPTRRGRLIVPTADVSAMLEAQS